MRRLVVLALASLFAIAACGGTAPAASRAPGASGITIPSVPPAGGVDPNTICAGIPTFTLETPSPSFAHDTALEARFPASIDGNARESVTSGYYLEQNCYYSHDKEAIARFAAIFPPGTVQQISQGSAEYTIDDQSVTLSAFRVPGTDPNAIFSHLPEFLAAIGIEAAEIPQYSLAQVNVGGKNVYALTEPDGEKAYSLVSGDTVFNVDADDEAVAAKVIAAIQ